MNARMKIRILGAILSIGAVASFAGALSGTIAWYAYSTRVSISYSGTSVSNSEMLQIGLDITGINLARYDLEEHELYDTVTVSGHTYAFAKPGVGMKSMTITDYLAQRGYASTELAPVTSREFTNDALDAGADSTFTLWNAPISGKTDFYTADNNKVCYITFAFRIQRSDNSYSSGDKIWLNDVKADPKENDQHVYKALRVYVDGENDFIINPSYHPDDDSTYGLTKVGGLLNLRGGGSTTYDVNDSKEEIIYGDYNTPVTAPHRFESTYFEDINGSGYDTVTTFSANHLLNTYGYSTGDFVAKTAKYRPVNAIAPTDDGTGGLTEGYPLCTTADNTVGEDTTKNIGVVDMKIYLEGWDFSVIDKEISHGFSLGLQFQINRI